MNSRGDCVALWQRQETPFWAAATLGVPLLLSAAVLLVLLTRLIFEGSGIPMLNSRLVTVGVVELVLAFGSVWLAGRHSNWTTGVAVAGAITGFFTLAAVALTI